MGVTIRGLKQAETIPSQIEFALQRLKVEVTPLLVEDFIRHEPDGGKWPKGRRKSIQKQTKGIIRGNRIIVGTFHSRYARSLDQGGTVQPRKKKVMRFRNELGEFVFTRKTIRHAPRPYFAAVLRNVPVIFRSVYERVFAEVGNR